MPEKYEEAINLAEKEKLCLHMAEQKVFGSSHAEIGAYLLNIWGLPEDIVRTAAFHHNPMAAYSSDIDCLIMVHIVDCLEQLKNPINIVGVPCSVDEELLKLHNLEEKFLTWQDLILKESQSE
jgi:HD-like signal output (HDOD) protein